MELLPKQLWNRAKRYVINVVYFLQGIKDPADRMMHRPAHKPVRSGAVRREDECKQGIPAPAGKGSPGKEDGTWNRG